MFYSVISHYVFDDILRRIVENTSQRRQGVVLCIAIVSLSLNTRVGFQMKINNIKYGIRGVIYLSCGNTADI